MQDPGYGLLRSLLLRAQMNRLGYRRSFSCKDVATTPPDRNVNTLYGPSLCPKKHLDVSAIFRRRADVL
jgi:hypothetical protein